MSNPSAPDIFDLIVIGGGIHGLMTAIVAAERGRSVLVVEKSCFGRATSNAWFGILHGGLRYLQTFDLRRYRKALGERRWFLRNMPEHVTIRPFLMPLYGRGLKRRSVFRMAFLLDALLSVDRNRHVRPLSRLKPGHVFDRDHVIEMFPQVRREGLEGGAFWQEAVVPDMDGLIDHLLGQARELGVRLRPRCAATALLQGPSGDVHGLRYTTENHKEETAQADWVINAAGPWAETLACQLDPTHVPATGLSLAFNLVLNKPAPCAHGISVAPPDKAGDMLFLYPLGSDQTFLGTWYVPCDGPSDAPLPTAPQITAFLAAVRASIPGYDIAPSDIARVTAGALPTVSIGSQDLLSQARVVDHGAHGGPAGLTTVIGPKYTTARDTARLALNS